MQKIIRYSVALFFFYFFYSPSTYARAFITDYHTTFFPAHDKHGQLVIAIRSYYLGAKPYFLVVDPYTLRTQALSASDLSARRRAALPSERYFTYRQLNSTPYMRALFQYTGMPYAVENAGITHANHAVVGEFLTIDMCPSSHVFEKKFFMRLLDKANQTHKKLPIALSVSGLWILGHEQEFSWLLQEEKANKFDITWTNHSFSHVYYRDLPLDQNFLLMPQTNFSQEVLATEKLLLERGELPSVFFRFPGLISSKQLLLALRDQFSLIPVGTNAWLAHGGLIKTGSIILVHGNGNEPAGIAKIMPLIQTLTLLPLQQAY